MAEPKLVLILMEDEITSLNNKQKDFYYDACEALRNGMKESDFLDILFNYGVKRGFFFEPRLSHEELLKQPLYLVIEQIWLELGVRQGTMKRTDPLDPNPTKVLFSSKHL